jgi:release factor glutamine methyltransferase
LQARGASLHIADIGTGSGALAVALAVNLPQVSIYATDSSADALAVASQNVWRYGVGEQVQLLPGHLCDPLPEPVDIVVANLPYVSTPDLAHLPPQVRDFEPWLALDGGPAGLQVIAQLLADLSGPARSKKLRPGARIFLEIGAAQGNAVHALAQAAFPDAVVGVWQDYADLDRLVVIAT